MAARQHVWNNRRETLLDGFLIHRILDNKVPDKFVNGSTLIIKLINNAINQNANANQLQIRLQNVYSD